MKTYIVTFDAELDCSSIGYVTDEEINDLVQDINSGGLNDLDLKCHSATTKNRVVSFVNEVDIYAKDAQDAIDQVTANMSSGPPQASCSNFKATEKP